MAQAKSIQFIKFVAFLVVAVSILLLAAACSSGATPNTQSQPNQAVPGTVDVSGQATEITGPNISLNTPNGPMVLKIDANTVFVRLDGSPGARSDIRPGMNVKVTYNSSTGVATRIQIQ